MGNRVLVVGGNHQNPLGVIEAFGQKGILSDVIIMGKCKKSFVLKSKYIARSWICHTDDDVITTIIANFTDTKNKAVAIACCDDAACLLNEYSEILERFLYLPGTHPQGSLKRWQDKEYMTEAAAKIGMTIPKTRVVTDKVIPADIEYPCITKSLTSVKLGKSEFALCQNEEELKDFLETKTSSETIQVQQYIDKEYEFQFIGCSLNGGETVFIPGDTYIEPGNGFNNLTFLRYGKKKVLDSLAIINLCEEFVRQTGYSGLFSIEFIQGKDGKEYFLEMNFRNDGNGAVVTASGTNLPFIWYLYNTGGDYRKEIEMSTVKETYSAPEDSYFMSMLEGHISYRQWRENMKKVSCYITYFPGDTKPFWALLWLQKKPILATLVKRVLGIKSKN